MNAHPSPWLRRWDPRPGARMRLVCFPHAGGGAGAFRGWSALLPPSIELICVQYPGREDRFGDQLVDDMDQLVAGIAGALARLTDRPYLVFGHSMGAAVAFETVRALRSSLRPEPEILVVSGRRAPDRFRGGQVHLRDDDGLCAELDRLGGTHADVLADPVLRAAVLTYVRNDYRLIENHHPRPGPPLGCPIAVFIGDEDPELDLAGAAEWQALTTGRTDVRTFAGDHFYLSPRRAEVVAAILRRVDPAIARAGGGWEDGP